MATATLSEKLSFAWTGDFDLLKQFVSENLKLDGTWSQLGGDKKLFTFEDSMIIWRKNKNLLSFDGEKASDVIKELCQLICTDSSEVVKPTIMIEHIEYGNQLHVYDVSNAESNNPIVSDELANSVLNNRDGNLSSINLKADENALNSSEGVKYTKQLNGSSGIDSKELQEECSNDEIVVCPVSVNNFKVDQTTVEEHQEKYANVVASHPPPIMLAKYSKT